MECKSRIVGYDEFRKTITVSVPSMDGIEKYLNTDIRLNVKEWREGRSKSANAYFHTLSDKLADHMRMSKPKMKNYLLFNYGQRVRDENGMLVVMKTNANEEELISRTDIHLWFLKDDPKDGIPMYVLLEHSRFYDSLQMSILIDGVIDECKAVGIETLPPREIEKMKKMWGEYEKHNSDGA